MNKKDGKRVEVECEPTGESEDGNRRMVTQIILVNSDVFVFPSSPGKSCSC